eukprot:7339713-Ditylum_brightwellii.AAC.1
MCIRDRNGASPSTESSSRITPMVLAAQCDFHQALSILVGGGAPIDQCNASGETALKAAATSGAIASIKQLVALGAVVDNEVEGVTPLHAAISAQNMASVEALCALGADVNRESHNGLTPLGWACRLGDTDV